MFLNLILSSVAGDWLCIQLCYWQNRNPHCIPQYYQTPGRTIVLQSSDSLSRSERDAWKNVAVNGLLQRRIHVRPGGQLPPLKFGIFFFFFVKSYRKKFQFALPQIAKCSSQKIFSPVDPVKFFSGSATGLLSWSSSRLEREREEATALRPLGLGFIG